MRIKVVEEFLTASGQSRPLAAFRSRSNSLAAHERLWSLFLDYCFVGGMPEAVAAWFHDDADTRERENFVQTELRARVAYPTYGWAEARAEVEFLQQASDGEIVPVEVKSGARRRARSLSSYIQRYAPPRAVTLTASPRTSAAGVVVNWPLNEAQFLREL